MQIFSYETLADSPHTLRQLAEVFGSRSLNTFASTVVKKFSGDYLSALNVKESRIFL